MLYLLDYEYDRLYHTMPRHSMPCHAMLCYSVQQRPMLSYPVLYSVLHNAIMYYHTLSYTIWDALSLPSLLALDV